MHKVIYSKSSIKDLKKLDITLAQRIIKKVDFFACQNNPLDFAKSLKQFGDDKYRFRIGDYRVIFKIDANGTVKILMILNIKHRKEIYLN